MYLLPMLSHSIHHPVHDHLLCEDAILWSVCCSLPCNTQFGNLSSWHSFWQFGNLTAQHAVVKLRQLQPPAQKYWKLTGNDWVLEYGTQWHYQLHRFYGVEWGGKRVLTGELVQSWKYAIMDYFKVLPWNSSEGKNKIHKTLNTTLYNYAVFIHYPN